MRIVENFACGAWSSPGGAGRIVRSAVTGEPVAEVRSDGVDFAAAVEHARSVGGPSLRALTFHQRAALLRTVADGLTAGLDALYDESAHTGATRSDSWVDLEGGIMVLKAYASTGRRELPDGKVLIDGDSVPLSKDGSFLGVHVFTPLHGVAVHINAYNFPVWGMLEKLAPTWLAGLPAIVKAAPQTSFVTELAVRTMLDSGAVPDGALQFVGGDPGDLLDHLGGQDVVAFTGSATTGQLVRSHPNVVARSVRVTTEADSLNAAILAPSAAPGGPEFDLFADEVVREMTAKAGQKCTAIRRVLVPESRLAEVRAALVERLGAVEVGSGMGPLVDLDQRSAVMAAVDELSAATSVVWDGADLSAVDAVNGAFCSPVLLEATDRRSPVVHTTEAFGPVATLVPYGDLDDAVELAALGQGSLVASVYVADPTEASALTIGIASHHGRVHVVDATSGPSSTGHGSPLPTLVHGGPGRAGGGEELGGLIGVKHYLQRTAVQGSPDMLTAITGELMPGATRNFSKGHPFKLFFEDLEIGDALRSDEREITLADIEAFAELTGDTFYAHMDDEAAKASPIFEGRVAHGYLVVSAAAGLFVWPDPGPVLANYGLERLRFAAPTYPGDRLTVLFTAKAKKLQPGRGYGEVTWDTQVINQDGKVAAAYDVLTLVACKDGGS